MLFKSLGPVSCDLLHEAFISAFSDYEVRVDMPPDKFRRTLRAKDYNAAVSVGCFEGEKPAGFILTGLRERDGRRCGYDIATGVIAGMQNRGIGRLLLEHLERLLPEQGVSSFVLEVLENNSAARKLYQSCGFTPRRYLRCFEAERLSIIEKYPKEQLCRELPPGTVPGRAELLPSPQDEAAYLSFQPSWQNELATYRNTADDFSVISLSLGGELAGYGVIERKEGSVLQLGIKPDLRDSGIGSCLVAMLAEETSSGKIRFINVEDGSPLCSLLGEHGFVNFINQFEMIKHF